MKNSSEVQWSQECIMKNPDAIKVILDRSQKLPSILTGRAWNASTTNDHKSFAAQTESVKHKMLCKKKY
ncbi:hypothetical protein H5410_012212 [Solanum commersonii]|uniref:Uncharacterized protein n=1 Tax=Solanum commersonii TaxID=4109 RepID=A0A9J6ARZ8_SOLCO|nr:hypothetical protein H5410_012212 [Solanum commersonii]